MSNSTYFEHGYALLIGIRYGHWQNVRPLNGTLRDVEDIKDHFLNPDKAAYKKENIIALTEENATAEGILKALDVLAAKANQDKDATVIVHYSGHGETDGQNYFFVPYDFDLKQWQEDGKFDKDKVVLSKQFVEKIDNIQADKKLIILDCCHSENIVERSLRKQTPLFLDGLANELDSVSETHTTKNVSTTQLKKGSGSVILTSCKANETSLDLGENGLFTQVLLESFNGTKNIEQDGWVRLIDMMRYLPSEVAERATKYLARGEPHQQHPVFKRIENIGHEDFIICAYDIAQARGLKFTPITEPKPSTIMPIDYKYISDFIAKGKVEKAIGEIRTVAYQIKNDDVIAEVDSLSQRYSTNERKQRLGILNNDKYNEERNKITFALLELINRLKSLDSNAPSSGGNTTNISENGNIVIQDVQGGNVNIGNVPSQASGNPVNSAKPNKDKILGLIDSNLDEAFDMLDEAFGKTNGIYNDFNNEYFSRSDNFNMETFRSKLKRFVKRKL